MVENQQTKIILLKGKLEHHLKKYLNDNHARTLHFKNFVINLKQLYSEFTPLFESFAENLIQCLDEYKLNNNLDAFMNNVCIDNLTNESIIMHLLNFVDMSRNYALEAKITTLEKEVAEIKKNNHEQSNKIEKLSKRLNMT
jgi:hypothetical protein